MKRSVSRLLAILLSFLFVFQTGLTAFADDNEPDWQDVTLTQEEFDSIIAQNPNNQPSTYASGLIAAYSIALSASGTTLTVAGKTFCAPDVVKCGFKIVTIQRRKSSSTSWTTYKTYEDLYDNDPSYALSKKITVPTGYQYRVTCTHYAKKSIFSTEKISNTSNVLAIG